MKVINLFGSPGAGKSTTASGLFYGMKHLGFNVELVTEYAKSCVWGNKEKTLNDQLYVTAKQNHQLEILRGQVDFVINDSPLLLGLIYKRHTMYPSFDGLVKELFNSYENFNVLLRRTKPYNPKGRQQTESQSIDVAVSIKDMLQKYLVPHVEVLGNLAAPRMIWKELVEAQFVPNLAFPIDLEWLNERDLQ